LKAVIAGLDVIAPHVTIQPHGEQANRATGAVTMDQGLRPLIDNAATTAGASDHDHDEAVRCAREEPELETGA
jgi:hypothetical protein